VIATKSVPWSQFLFSAALLVILVGALHIGATTLRSIAETPISRVKINGDLRFLDQQVLEQIVRAHLAEGFFGIDLQNLRVEIEQLPWAQDCEIRRLWPDQLQILITEEVPTLRWGETELLNPIGQVFRPASMDGFTDLPMLEGPAGSEQMMLQRFDALMEQLVPLGRSISSLHLDGKHSWSLVLDGGLRVVLGRRELDRRTGRLFSLLRHPDEFAAGGGAVLDLRYSNGFTMTPGERWAGLGAKQEKSTGESG